MNNCSIQRYAPWCALLGALALTGCHHAPLIEPVIGASGSAQATPLKDTRGIPIIADPNLTPGAVLPVTKADICVPGYSSKVRNVPASVKAKAYAEYGINSHKPGEYEVDHSISLELGGSNSIKNLWPQSYKTQPWNAHVKDVLENRLHADVCTNKVDLPTAQKEIGGDWVAAYKRIFHTDKPLASGSGRHHSSHKAAYDSAAPTKPVTPPVPPPAVSVSAPAAAPTAGQVWVNTKSGKYFDSTSRYYGKTKQGKFLSEADAKKQGYVAAQGQ